MYTPGLNYDLFNHKLSYRKSRLLMKAWIFLIIIILGLNTLDVSAANRIGNEPENIQEEILIFEANVISDEVEIVDPDEGVKELDISEDEPDKKVKSAKSIELPEVRNMPLKMADNDFTDHFGEAVIKTDSGELIRHATPDVYYGNIDYSTFQPYMSYTAVTNRGSKGYSLMNSNRAYTDQFGFRRTTVPDDQFKIDGEDDYFIALGNYYKEKGSVGGRYLIVTSTGMYTAMVGDEKANAHTDQYNMFGRHGRYAGVIEWIVDARSGRVPREILRDGTVTSGPVKAHQGKILYIYEIEDNNTYSNIYAYNEEIQIL